MGTLILKSKSTLNNTALPLELMAYKQRVLADGGEIQDEQALVEAFEFALSNGINSYNGFSITSPKWGAKVSGGKILKLYSLFGSSGDLVPISTGTSVTADNTSLAFSGSNSQGYRTAGAIGTNKSQILSIKHKVTNEYYVDYGGSGYGNNRSLYLGYLLTDVPPSQSSAEQRGDDGLLLGYLADSVGQEPSGWSSRANLDQSDASADITQPGGVIEGMSINMAAYASNSELSLYKNGSMLESKQAVIYFADSMELTIGHGHVSYGYDYAQTSPFLGEVEEVWCVIEANNAIAQALSGRV